MLPDGALVVPVYIEFKPDRIGSFGFIVVTGLVDCRSAVTVVRA
jgi:hypothetical protein